MYNPPLQTIQKLIQERYKKAKAVFWAGSVLENRSTEASDLDLVIVYEHLPNAYREAFIYNEWPIDAFVHDIDTLRYFFEESRSSSGIPGLISMILNGREILTPTDFSKSIRILAKEILKAGPAAWDKKRIGKERFFITDALEDIKFHASKEEQTASAVWLYEALSQFYFRSQNKWCASGKSIIRNLKQENPQLAQKFTQSFENFFQTGSSADLEHLVKNILAAFGGLLWDGFRSDAPEEFRISDETKHRG